jgi:acyl carrier protein
MDEKAIYEKLTAIFRDVMDDDSIVLQPTTAAKDIPEWDSFNHVNIIVTSEMKFGVKFTTGEIERLSNVGDFVALIKGKVGPG